MGHTIRWLAFAMLFTVAGNTVAWAEWQKSTEYTADEHKKLEMVRKMFQSPYSEEDYYRTDRLLVTATGSQLPVHKAPAVASIVTAEDIERIGATCLEEILETVPGLHVSPSFNRMNSIFSFRGIQTKTNPQVLLLMNGIPVTQALHGHRVSTFHLPVADISRVEVVRGPGSAVHGADAFAGTINVITKDVHELKTFKSGIRAGSFETLDAWSQGGARWNGWDMALSLEYVTSNGDSDRIVETDLQSSLDGIFGTSASKTPAPLNTAYNIFNSSLGLRKDNWNTRLWYWQQHDGGVGTGSTNVLEPGSRENAEQFLADITYRNDKAALDWDFKGTLSYMYIKDDVYFVLFPPGAVLPIGSDGNLFTAGGGLVSFPQGVIGHPSATENHYAIDLETFYTGMRRHRLRLGMGLKYIEEEASESKNFGPGVIDGTQPVVGGSLTDISGSEFVYIKNRNRNIWYASVQDAWSLARKWELTAGIRYDKYSDFGCTFNPRMALVWETRYDLTTKLLYGRAFRPPSFGELYLINNPSGLGNPNLDPETIETYELAFDYQPTSNLHTILNLFKYDIDDLIEYVQRPGEAAVTAQNEGNQNGYGFELEMDWEIAYGLRLRADYAYQHSEDETSQAPVPDAPRKQLHCNPQWEFLPDWSLDAQYYWIGDRRRAAGDTRTEIDDYSLVNLVLRRKGIAGSWAVAFAVKNLLDEDIREPAPAAIPDDYPMPGRSIFVELRYDYKR